MNYLKSASHIFIHDFGSYKFVLDCVEELSKKFEYVTYSYSGDLNNAKTNQLNLPSGIEVSPIRTRHNYNNQTTLFRRLIYEIVYAFKLIRKVVSKKPDIVILANTPLISAWLVISILKKTTFVFWQQDLLSLMMSEHINGRFRNQLTRALIAMERTCLSKSKSVITISESFLKYQEQLEIDLNKCIIVPNWPAKVAEIEPKALQWDWLQVQGVPKNYVRILYSGKIGVKHDPFLFAQLHDLLMDHNLKFSIVILSDDFLPDESCNCETRHIFKYPYQNDDIYENILGHVDAGLLGLTFQASKFSLPSKALTYLSAGLRTIGFLDFENPVANLIARYEGFCYLSPQEDISGFLDWIRQFNREQETSFKSSIIDRVKHEFAPEENIFKISDEIQKISDEQTK